MDQELAELAADRARERAAERIDAVRRLLTAGRVRTASDRYHAALVLGGSAELQRQRTD
jgi:hypothetical protein